MTSQQKPLCHSKRPGSGSNAKKLNKYLNELMRAEAESTKRNNELLSDISEITTNAMAMQQKTDYLRNVRNQYEKHFQNVYPKWNPEQVPPSSPTPKKMLSGAGNISSSMAFSDEAWQMDPDLEQAMQSRQATQIGTPRSMYTPRDTPRDESFTSRNISHSTPLPPESLQRQYKDFIKKKMERWKDIPSIPDELNSTFYRTNDQLIDLLQERINKCETHLRDLGSSGNSKEADQHLDLGYRTSQRALREIELECDRLKMDYLSKFSSPRTDLDGTAPRGKEMKSPIHTHLDMPVERDYLEHRQAHSFGNVPPFLKLSPSKSSPYLSRDSLSPTKDSTKNKCFKTPIYSKSPELPSFSSGSSNGSIRILPQLIGLSPDGQLILVPMADSLKDSLKDSLCSQDISALRMSSETIQGDVTPGSDDNKTVQQEKSVERPEKSFSPKPKVVDRPEKAIKRQKKMNQTEDRQKKMNQTEEKGKSYHGMENNDVKSLLGMMHNVEGEVPPRQDTSPGKKKIIRKASSSPQKHMKSESSEDNMKRFIPIDRDSNGKNTNSSKHSRVDVVKQENVDIENIEDFDNSSSSNSIISEINMTSQRDNSVKGDRKSSDNPDIVTQNIFTSSGKNSPEYVLNERNKIDRRDSEILSVLIETLMERVQDEENEEILVLSLDFNLSIMNKMIKFIKSGEDLGSFNTSQICMVYRHQLQNFMKGKKPFLSCDLDTSNNFEGHLRDCIDPTYGTIWDALYTLLSMVMKEFDFDPSQVATIFSSTLVPSDDKARDKLQTSLSNILQSIASEGVLSREINDQTETFKEDGIDVSEKDDLEISKNLSLTEEFSINGPSHEGEVKIENISLNSHENGDLSQTISFTNKIDENTVEEKTDHVDNVEDDNDNQSEQSPDFAGEDDLSLDLGSVSLDLSEHKIDKAKSTGLHLEDGVEIVSPDTNLDEQNSKEFHIESIENKFSAESSDSFDSDGLPVTKSAAVNGTEPVQDLNSTIDVLNESLELPSLQNINNKQDEMAIDDFHDENDEEDLDKLMDPIQTVHTQNNSQCSATAASTTNSPQPVKTDDVASNGLRMKKPGFWEHSESESEIDIQQMSKDNELKSKADDDDFDFEFFD